MQIKSEDAFPEMLGFQCSTLEKYSFNPSGQHDCPVIEGELIDDCTFVGIIRLDLNSKTSDAAKILDEFSVELSINKIEGYLAKPKLPDYGKTQKELEAMSDEEWENFMDEWHAEHPDYEEQGIVVYEGPWNFTLDVKADASDTQIVEVNDINEQGIGIEKVVKDRFEITMYDSYSDESMRADYVPVMLDADGRLMDYGGGGSINTVAINNRNVSKVDIFLIEYYLWMDGGLKGDCWRKPNAKTEDGRTYKELLLEKCSYHTEIVWDK